MPTTAGGSHNNVAGFPQIRSRREALKAMIAGTVGLGTFQHPGSALAADVDWLAEVQQSPKTVPRNKIGYFEPLLVGDDGKPIRTQTQWEKQRRTLRKRWMDFLGPMPDRPQVKLKILSEDCPRNCVRQLVRYESEPGIQVEGYLLQPEKPADRGKHSGIVALHQTTKTSIEEIAGVNGPESQHLGLKLCRRGFVVFCPRCYLWQSASSYREADENFRRRHPKTLGMRKMLYDAMRGVDVLQSLPDVDPLRLGAVGHSLGAKEALYLAAFDERVKAAVASEGGISFHSTNWEAPWYLGKGIQAPGFQLNHHQLLALIAPHPFLILAGESGQGASDGDRTWPFIEAALPVDQLYGKPARLGIYNHRQGHTIPPKAFQRMAQWLETYVPA